MTKGVTKLEGQSKLKLPDGRELAITLMTSTLGEVDIRVSPFDDGARELFELVSGSMLAGEGLTIDVFPWVVENVPSYISGSDVAEEREPTLLELMTQNPPDERHRKTQ